MWYCEKVGEFFFIVYRYFCNLLFMQTRQTLTLLVLYTLNYIHCEGHFLSSSAPRESLRVLTSHIHQSVQQPFLSQRFVPPVLTKKTMHSTKGYMPHSIDCSQKYFWSYESWQDKYKTMEKYAQIPHSNRRGSNL